MSKFYLSGAAKRKACQERETKAAKMLKISKFLKPADSALENTLDLVIESKSCMINAATVEMNISNQNSTLETTVAVTVPLDLGNETEDISNTSTISEGDNEKTVESITAKINPSDKANFREPLAHEDRQMVISLGPCQPIGPFQRDSTQKGRCFSESFYTKVSQAELR